MYARKTGRGIVRWAPSAVLAVAFIIAPNIGIGHAAVAHDGFWTALAPAMTAVTGWTLRGVALAADGAGKGNGNGNGTLRLAPSTAPLACAPAAIDGGAVAYDPAAGLCAGHDPYAPGTYNGRDYYNSGHFHFGTLLSPPLTSISFDRAVASWVAATPPGTWLELHLRVRLETHVWTRWYALPIWASGAETIQRHSIDGQGGAGMVATDTLVLHPGRTAIAYQLEATLFTEKLNATPMLRRLSLAVSHTGAGVLDPAPAQPSAVWGHDLPVPAHSQMLARYHGGGGEVWCSPTSLAMILGYWAHRLGRSDLAVSVPQAASGVYDWTYAGTGNWPFNVAYATSFPGMDGYVTHFSSLAALEPWIAAGVPLALSIAFAPGALPRAPLPSSDGHLLVLRGFDPAGNPIVDDPAAPSDAAVSRPYPRAALERAWLAGSGGTTYAIFPYGWAVPARASGG